MRHIIDSHRNPHTNIPNFKFHSRFLVIFVALFHPLLAIFSLKVASFIEMIIEEFSVGLGVVYSVDPANPDPKFENFAGSDMLYPILLALIILFIAIHAGIFRAFRINQFWPNFIVSLVLLIISLLVFAGGNISSLFV